MLQFWTGNQISNVSLYNINSHIVFSDSLSTAIWNFIDCHSKIFSFFSEVYHCIKSVRIRSNSGPYFPIFAIWFKSYILVFKMPHHDVISIVFSFVWDYIWCLDNAVGNAFPKEPQGFEFDTRHCVKSVDIRSYSCPYFPTFGLNRESCSVSLRIQSQCGKIRIRITPNTDTFYAVYTFILTKAFLIIIQVYVRNKLQSVHFY